MSPDRRPGAERQELILVRHAEALKNLAHERGGQGTGLTEVGVEQGHRLAGDLDSLGGEPIVIAYHEIPHVRETLDQLRLARPCTCLAVPELVGIDLGSLDGVGADDAERLFPGPATDLERWKAGELSVDRLNLPGAEDLGEFERRVRDALSTVLAAGERLVLLGTQSTLIMVQNILELGSEFSYEQYRHVKFPHCGGFRWEVEAEVGVESHAFP